MKIGSTEIVRRVSVDGYETTGVGLHQVDCARSVALVYGGVGDGKEIAAKLRDSFNAWDDPAALERRLRELASAPQQQGAA